MRRFIRPILSILLVLAIPRGTLANGTPPDVRVTQVDNGDYPNVTVYVSVTDAASKAVSGLQQGDFRLTEDGQEVQIVDFSGGEDIAISTVMVLDRSGSMSGSKLSGAKQAALKFVELVRSQDQAALIVFDDRVDLVQGLAADRAALEASIRRVSTRGGTAWRDALFQAVDLLQGASGRQCVILLTDGRDNESRHSLNEVIQHAVDAGIPVYAIGLGRDADRANLQRVAQGTGGIMYHMPSAAELEALYESLARGMQKEYALTYRSPRPTYDGTRRKIVVSVRGQEGESDYLEQHLLNVRSDPLVGLAFVMPLAAALAVPPLTMALRRRKKAAAPTPAFAVPSDPSLGSRPVASPYAPPSYAPPPSVPPDPSLSSGPPSSAPPPAGAGFQTALCPICGATIRPGAQFCPGCGARQVAPAQRNCVRCGQPLRVGAKFCNRCGAQQP